MKEKKHHWHSSAAALHSQRGMPTSLHLICVSMQMLLVVDVTTSCFFLLFVLIVGVASLLSLLIIVETRDDANKSADIVIAFDLRIHCVSLSLSPYSICFMVIVHDSRIRTNGNAVISILSPNTNERWETMTATHCLPSRSLSFREHCVLLNEMEQLPAAQLRHQIEKKQFCLPLQTYRWKAINDNEKTYYMRRTNFHGCDFYCWVISFQNVVDNAWYCV